MPPTVVAETTGTIWSPWPPSTIAAVLIEAGLRHEIAITGGVEDPGHAEHAASKRDAAFATWHIASSGLETTIRIELRERLTISRVTDPTIASLVVTRSSRDIPGERGLPAVITTTSEPSVSS